jgi:hypothetical protein
MSSGYSPLWRRLLQRYTPLFRLCPSGNYHWRWDRVCRCAYGDNGQPNIRFWHRGEWHHA